MVALCRGVEGGWWPALLETSGLDFEEVERDGGDQWESKRRVLPCQCRLLHQSIAFNHLIVVILSTRNDCLIYSPVGHLCNFIARFAETISL